MTAVTNIVFAGLGGQGVLKASDICAEAAFRTGLDVKKAEVHGMSQRGGSVTSDVRFGPVVASPMVAPGEAHFLVILEATQVRNNLHWLRPDGMMLTPDAIDVTRLAHPRCLNVAMLGLLSRHLAIDPANWHVAIAASLPDQAVAMNLAAFDFGRSNA